MRDALMQAAETIAAENDFKALDIHEVAAVADVSPDEIEAHVQDNGELAYELSMNVLRQLRDETMQMEAGTVARMEHYVTNAMRIMVDSSLAFVKEWIADTVNEDVDRGSRRLVWGWHVLADIIRAGIESGELAENTPISRLTGLVLAEFYGTIFLWSVLQGSLDAVRAVREYCQHVFPNYLEPYTGRIGQDPPA